MQALLLAVPLALSSGMAFGQIVVDTILNGGNPLTTGIYPIVGDTTGGADNVTNYQGFTNPDARWFEERVFQFTVNSTSVYQLLNNSIAGDPDFFLLDSLDTVEDTTRGYFESLNTVAADFLDLGADGAVRLLSPGTYYLVADAFGGIEPPYDSSTTIGAFDVSLSIIEATPPTNVVALGQIAGNRTPLTFDATGSVLDAQLGIYDSDGFLLAEDDVNASQIDLPNSLGVGSYFLAASGFETIFNDGFQANPQPGNASGDLLLEYPDNGSTSTFGPQAVASGEVAWFSFEIFAEPPTSTTDLGVLQALSTITTENSPVNVDAHIAIFDADGNLLSQAINPVGGFAELAAPNLIGDYFLAIAGYETDYSDGWGAVSDAANNPFADGVEIFNSGDMQVDYVQGDGTPANTGTFLLDVNAVEWFEFSIDTVATVDPPETIFADLGQIAVVGEAITLTTTNPGTDFDTELGLYDDQGTLLATNDDEDFPNDIVSSLIEIVDGLDVGTYYLALGEFNTAFGALFNVTTNGPNPGNFELTANSATSSGSIQAGEVLWFQFSVGEEAVGLTGDFNGDGIVDAADYTVWRDSLGETGVELAADANGDEVVDSADYDLWRANFGATLPPALAAAAAVPEPSTLVLVAVGLALAAGCRRGN
jgi:hypothetical protein